MGIKTVEICSDIERNALHIPFLIGDFLKIVLAALYQKD